MLANIWEQIKGQWIGIVLAVVLALGTTIYSLNKTTLAGQVYYQVEQVQLFDKGTADSNLANLIQIVDDKGNKLAESLFVATIKVWNAGNDEIKLGDVRQDYTIVLERVLSIVSASIIKQNLESQNFAIAGKVQKADRSTELPGIDLGNTQSYVVSWDHFDNGAGFTMRVAYVAREKINIKFTGSAAKALPIREATSDILNPQISVLNALSVFNVFTGVCVGVGTLIMRRRLRGVLDVSAVQHTLKIAVNVLSFLSIIPGVISLALVAFRAYSRSPTPPF